MNKILSLLALLAFSSRIDCTCQPYSQGQFLFPNNNLAVGVFSSVFNTASYAYNKLTNNGVSLWCKWFGWGCPTCQNLKSMSGLNSTSLSGNWYAVASRNMAYDDDLTCRRENFAFSGNTTTWTTTIALNEGNVSSSVNGNGIFTNGVLSLSSGKSARVISTDYSNYLILQVCDPSQGVFMDEFELLVRANSTEYVDLPIIAQVFYKVVFVNGQNPFTIPFVGRCGCSTLPA